jgi:hypothetical protein
MEGSMPVAKIPPTSNQPLAQKVKRSEQNVAC